jgi:hypothetical protein
MTRDDLSNVLVKLFGFTVAVRAILMLPQYIISYGAYLFRDFGSVGSHMTWQIVALLFGVAVRVIGGFAIVVKSSTVSQWLLSFGTKEI